MHRAMDIPLPAVRWAQMNEGMIVAVLMRGEAVVAGSVNTQAQNIVKVRDDPSLMSQYHAEQRLLSKQNVQDHLGRMKKRWPVELYVLHWNKTTGWGRSRPCRLCLRILNTSALARVDPWVTFTDHDGRFKVMRLSSMRLVDCCLSSLCRTSFEEKRRRRRSTTG